MAAERKTTGGRAAWAAGALALVALPYLLGDDYYIHVAIMILMYGLLASSLNLLVGYTGQLSIGHAAFFGIGAYASALLAKDLGAPFFVSMLGGGAIAGFFGVCLGLPSLKLAGPYLAITTIGFAEIVRYVFMNWKGLTRGPMGLIGIPDASIGFPGLGRFVFDTKPSYYYMTLAVVALSVFVMRRIVASRVGKAFVSIREDETLSDALGVNCTRYKVYAFSLGAAFAGIAGSLYAHYILFLSPETFSIFESSVILAMVIIGGSGTMWGPVLGAAVLTILPEFLRGVAQYRFFIFGVAMLVCILFMPDGMLGAWKAWREKGKPALEPAPEAASEGEGGAP